MTTTKGAKAYSSSGIPERYRWLPKADIVDALELRPGMSMAEIGACGGDLVLAAAEAIGPGRAFAIAAGPEEAARLRDAVRHGQSVEVIEAPEHSASIPAGSCHRVLMANVWTELPDALAALREAARLLGEDGRLIVVDWRDDPRHPEAPGTPVGFQEMVRLLEQNSWDIHRHGELGPHSYFLVAGVSDESVQS